MLIVSPSPSFESWILSFIAALGLLGVAWLGRHAFRSWLAPGSFFSLYWSIACLLALVLAPDFFVWPTAVFLLLAYALLMLFGSLVGCGALKYRSDMSRPNVREWTYCLVHGRSLLSTAFVVGLIAIPLLLSSRGYSLRRLFMPASIAVIARDFSIGRYREAYTPTLIVQFIRAISYAGSYLSGIWLGVTRSKRRWLRPFLVIAPMVLQGLITTMRNLILVPGLLILAGYMSTSVLIGKERSLLTRRAFCFLVVGILVASAGYVGLQNLRDDVYRASTTMSITKLRSSTLGSLSAFSLWLRESWDLVEPSWGAYLFAGTVDQLGIGVRKMGLYDEVVIFNNSSFTGMQSGTNIYTLFRSLIQDFTLLGSLFVVFIVGVIGGIVYRRVQRGELAFVPCLALFYFAVLWSYLSSVTAYNLNILAWSLFLFTSELFLRRVSPCDEKNLTP